MLLAGVRSGVERRRQRFRAGAAAASAALILGVAVGLTSPGSQPAPTEPAVGVTTTSIATPPAGVACDRFGTSTGAAGAPHRFPADAAGAAGWC
jgi:hypothetical protein